MRTLVILGTGGTIAGTASNPADHTGYTAAQRSIAQVVDAVPALTGLPLEAEQLAQIDSKDMDAATWQRLAQRCAHHLARPEVCGIVVTHGTDTLEESAYFLHRVLAPTKPVVLTAAMRPATAMGADGPQNLADAVAVAHAPGAAGVLAVVAGQVFDAVGLRKRHTYRLDAFSNGDSGPLAWVEEGQLRRLRPWPLPDPGPASEAAAQRAFAAIAADPATWPWVAVLPSHAGACGQAVDAWVAAGVQGLIIAATGNGTVHAELLPALARAEAAGVPVWRCSRCAEGVLVGAVAQNEAAARLTPWQARIALQLALLEKRNPPSPASA